MRPAPSFRQGRCVRLLVAAEQSSARSDPSAALAAHEQEVGLAWSLVWSCPSRGQVKLLHHQLAGALNGIVGIAVAPDMGTALGAHLDEVLAKHAAGPADSIGSWVSPPVVVRGLRPPLPVGERATGAVFIAALDEIAGDRKAGPCHAAVGAREDDLHAARRGVLTAAVHDR